MADIAGDSSTTTGLSIGGSLTDSLETVGDHDWIRITLTAGQAVVVTVNGGTLTDPYLYIRDSSGNLLYSNDDINPGVNTNSRVAFNPTYSGTYYIDVGAYADQSVGTYTVAVQPYSLPPVWTVDQIADQLVTGFWGGTSHHFNVTQGGTITVNISTLTAAEQNIARTALSEWTDIIGVKFAEVTTGGQIVFDNTEDTPGTPVAATDANYSRGITTSAHVQISSSWTNKYGTGLYSYSLQTYVHEIGHALGLGHAGNYNGSADYPYDALFQNDAWSTSIMSYFDPQENTYFGGKGFTFNYAVTPMQADILAMQKLYGLSTTTRSGDTVYGFNSNAGGVYNASLYPRASYTVFDSGGNDTLDFSGSSASQTLNLNAETYSNVNGYTGNISIARGVIIENATGGNGSDTIVGNAYDNVLRGNAGSDVFTGGGGSDSYIDTIANHSGDRITDFNGGDRLVFSNASLSSFTFSVSGDTLSFSGGSLILTGLAGKSLVASAAATGGVQLALTVSTTPIIVPVPTPNIDPAHNDLTGDGRSEILWRNDNGQFNIWSPTSSGGYITTYSTTAVGNEWHIVGTGDFNGDDRNDILWRNDDGQFNIWTSTGSSNFITSYSSSVATSTQVAGVGDFDNDGRDDIIWRSNTGQVDVSHSNGDSFTTVFTSSVAGSSWHVAGTGDFNGDGRSDILWRDDNGQTNVWQATSTGSFVTVFSSTIAGNDWQIAATGDFNGDGRSDILWRNANGQLNEWNGLSNGSFTTSYSANVATTLHLVGAGDFNGDHIDDILWRADNGQVTTWYGAVGGSFSSGSSVQVASSWHVEDPLI